MSRFEGLLCCQPAIDVCIRILTLKRPKNKMILIKQNIFVRPPFAGIGVRYMKKFENLKFEKKKL